MRHGELFITGRHKDLLIVNGRNIHPQDIEQLVEGLDPAMRSHGGAAFEIEADGAARLVVVQELESRRQPVLEGHGQRLRAELAEQFQLTNLAGLWLVKAGRLPRTSSGKIRRRECRRLFEQGQFGAAWSWQPHAQAPAAAAQATGTSELESTLHGLWRQCLGLEQLGLDDASSTCPERTRWLRRS